MLYSMLYSLSLAIKMNSTKIQTLAKEAMQQPRKKKNVKIASEKTVLADGSSFQPLEVKTSNDLLQASLLMLFKHVADVHVTVVEVIAEKFGLKVEDLHKAITEDPRWQAMLSDPFVTDLTATVEKQSVANPKPIKKKKPVIVLSNEDDLVFD